MESVRKWLPNKSNLVVREQRVVASASCTWNRICATIVGAMLYVTVVQSQSSVTIAVDTGSTGIIIPDDFIGLSFETQSVLPITNGKYIFAPENHQLLALLKSLGVRSLRIGGNTADRPTVALPSRVDIDYLFGFAEAAGTKVIYTLRLREGSSTYAAQTAEYIAEHYKEELDCFAIGNEPNDFAREYSTYRDEWKNYFEAITSEENGKDAMFCGPCSTPGKASWCRRFAGDFANSGHIKFIAQHAYPGGNGMKVTDQDNARRSMLSMSWRLGYQSLYDSFVPFIDTMGLAYRIEETNNFYNGGAVNVSDAFASALWGLDYLYWWASHGAIGVNFHTGDSVAAGERSTPCRYAVFWTVPDGYAVHPLGYAIKMFDVGCHGTLVPMHIQANPDSVDLSAYGVVSKDKSLFVTLINRECGKRPLAARVTLCPQCSFTDAKIMFLLSRRGDLAAKTDITLGGSTIRDDANWDGTWSPLRKSGDERTYIFELSPSSAALVKLTQHEQGETHHP